MTFSRRSERLIQKFLRIRTSMILYIPNLYVLELRSINRLNTLKVVKPSAQRNDVTILYCHLEQS
jgi:hypothetical protein